MRKIDPYDYEPYVLHIRNIVKLEMLDMDAIYKDHIMQLVGVFGFNTLIKYGCLEPCGVINGRQLYVLTDVRNFVTMPMENMNLRERGNNGEND